MQKFHTMAVTKLDVSRNASTTLGSKRLDVQLQSSHDVDGELWILYEDATVAIIQISELFAKINSAVFGKWYHLHHSWLAKGVYMK